MVNKSATVPEKIRNIYKGSILGVAPDQSINSIFERMTVMHTVFEGAAFAYMSLLAKYKFAEPRLNPINEIAKIIMKDEARHMNEGFQAIDLLKKSMVSSQIIEKTKEQVIIYAHSVRDLPSLTIKGEEDFQKQLYKLYDENVQRNMRRMFQ